MTFEFIDVSGKRASPPVCSSSQKFNGRFVKRLAGRGSVYVLFTKPPLTMLFSQNDIPDSDSSNSNFELPLVIS